MLEQKGNLFDINTLRYATGICVTTNGAVKRNGELVMGKGVALQAKTCFPRLPIQFGEMVAANGNRVYQVQEYIHGNVIYIFSFPTKYHWRDKSDLNLIAKSAEELSGLADLVGIRYGNIYLSRPGCGNGGLPWNQVKPVIKRYLNDRFVVLTPF